MVLILKKVDENPHFICTLIYTEMICSRQEYEDISRAFSLFSDQSEPRKHFGTPMDDLYNILDQSEPPWKPSDGSLKSLR